MSSLTGERAAEHAQRHGYLLGCSVDHEYGLWVSVQLHGGTLIRTDYRGRTDHLSFNSPKQALDWLASELAGWNWLNRGGNAAHHRCRRCGKSEPKPRPVAPVGRGERGPVGTYCRACLAEFMVGLCRNCWRLLPAGEHGFCSERCEEEAVARHVDE